MFKQFFNPLILPAEIEPAEQRFETRCAVIFGGACALGYSAGMCVSAAPIDIGLVLSQNRRYDLRSPRLSGGTDPLRRERMQLADGAVRLHDEITPDEQVKHRIAYKRESQRTEQIWISIFQFFAYSYQMRSLRYGI